MRRTPPKEPTPAQRQLLTAVSGWFRQRRQGPSYVELARLLRLSEQVVRVRALACARWGWLLVPAGLSRQGKGAHRRVAAQLTPEGRQLLT